MSNVTAAECARLSSTNNEHSMCVRVHAAERMNTAFPLHFPERHFPSTPQEAKEIPDNNFPAANGLPLSPRFVLLPFTGQCIGAASGFVGHNKYIRTKCKPQWKQTEKLFSFPLFFFVETARRRAAAKRKKLKNLGKSKSTDTEEDDADEDCGDDGE